MAIYVPTTKYGNGIPTNSVGTTYSKREHSVWDYAVGTDSGAVLNYLVGKGDNNWGADLETAIKYAKSERDVYNAVLSLGKAKTHGHIKNLDTGEYKHFQFNPEELKYSRGVNYTDNVAPGMAYPRTQFVSGQSREFDIDLFLYDRFIEPCGIIKDYMCFFGQFLTPEENVPDWKRPPQLLLFYGYFVRKCVLTNFDIQITNMDENGTPTMAHFILTLKQVGVV